MWLISGIIVFFIAIWWLHKKEIIENEHVAIIVVLVGSALAGYLGVSQY